MSGEDPGNRPPGDDHRRAVEALEETLAYEFDDEGLLERALTHRSYRTEHEEIEEDNQRLEYLGDEVLGLAIADALFHRHREVDEGVLSKRQSQLVRRSALARIAREIELGAYLRMGKGEVQSGGRNRDSVLADAYEALVGAMYLDSSFDVAKEVVLTLHGDLLEEVVGAGGPTDYKSRLQEWTQQQRDVQPAYEIIDERGPPHDKTFVAEVRVEGQTVGAGSGRSKQRAEQQAAAEAIQVLTAET